MERKKYDVVVAGGGPAGTAAAIAAARNGAKTLLIEQYGFLGGTPVNALVPVFCPFSDKQKAIVRGIGLEILERMKYESWSNPEPEEDNGIPGLDWVAIDPEVLKRVLDELVLESGAGLWLHTAVTGVTAAEGRITQIIACGKGGSVCVEAEIFIDCTGDADLAALGGAGFEYGSDGRVQGMTLCFRLAGVDGKRFLDYKKISGEDGNLHIAVERAKERNEFPSGESHVATFALQGPDIAGVNFGHSFEKSPLDTVELTQAEVESRRRLPELVQFFRKYVPGMEHCYVVASGPAIGVRETRRIIGEYRLTKEDYMQRRQFEDAIARYAYPIDVHAESEKAAETGKGDGDYISTAYLPGESYTIPYRSLLPKDLENVFVAGRAVSSDREVNGSVRVAPACFAMGQAAGTAAALSVRENCPVKKINIQKLRALLLEQGACL